MLSFKAIDVETANEDRESICQIGIVHVENGVICNQWTTLVDPEEDFSPWNILIHGITEDDIHGSPTLPMVYDELRNRLDGNVLVSHTTFDKQAITWALEKYGLQEFSVRWLDSARVVRRAWKDKFGRKGWGLKNVAKDLSISFRHHDALEDARATALIVLKACQVSGLDVEEWLERQAQPIHPTSASRRSKGNSVRRVGTKGGILEGETCVFTGALSSMVRRKAADLIATKGANVGPYVTKKTTMLVVGRFNNLKGQKSGKQKSAEEALRRGQEIKILSESNFCALVGVESPPIVPQTKKRMSRNSGVITFTPSSRFAESYIEDARRLVSSTEADLGARDDEGNDSQ